MEIITQESNLATQGRKGGGGKAHTPVETQNNLLSTSYAKVLLAVGEGPLSSAPTGREIFLGGTPLIGPTGLENFGGVKWEWRSGTSDQAYIQGMPETAHEITVGYTLESIPYTRLITDSSLDAMRVTLQWPALMQTQDNGDVVGYVIQYAIDVSTDGGQYVEVLNTKVDGKTNTSYERTHRINLPQEGSSWTVRVRRLTPKKTDSKVSDIMYVKSVADVVDAKLRYPNTALLYLEFDAQLFGGTSIPKISVKVKGRQVRVPTNYDPDSRTYNGIWNGTFKWAYSNNPAWVLLDICTNERFGLGGRLTVEDIDIYTLYQIAQYCDVMVSDGAGGTEPRYTYNGYLQNRAEAWQVLRDIVNRFNGMLHWNGSKLVATSDMPVNVASVQTYSRSQVIGGKFSYSTPSEKTIYTSAVVSYDDPTNHYETAKEAVNDLNLVARWKTWAQTDLTAIGCTSRGEAQRLGKYTMITNSLNRIVTFDLGMQGYLPTPGQVIGIADELLAGEAFAGRIHSATSTTVTLDRESTALPGDILYVNMADGVTGEGRTVKSVAGRVVTVTAAYTQVPNTELGWYLEKSDLKSQLFRVSKVTWDEDNNKFTVVASQYEDSKYAAVDNGARLETRPITKIPAGGQEAPASISIDTYSYTEQTLSVTTMRVSWPAVANAMNYEAQWRKDGGDWVNVGQTASTGFEVKGIYKGAYQARVRAINAIGVKSIWKESVNTELTGKIGLPPTLASLTTQSEIFGIRINWTFPEGAQDTAHIQLQQASTIDGQGTSELSLVAYPATTYLKSNMLGGVSAYFRGRLVDRSGNEGPWSPWTYGVSEYNADKILDYIAGEIGRTELGQDLLSELDTTKSDLAGVKQQVTDINAEVSAIDQQVQANKDELAGQIQNTWTQLGQQITNLNNSVTELEASVAADVNALNQSVAGLATRTTTVENKATALRTDLDAAVKAAEYDISKAYAVGDIVRKGQRLYQALIAVPVNKTPPNAVYWKDVGTTLQEAGATAAQVATHTTTITNQGNTLTSHTSQLTGLTTRITDAEANITGNATALSNLSSTVTQQGNTITSQGSAITNVQATVDGIAGAGTNLLEDKYSWLTSTTMPTVPGASGLVKTAVAVAGSDSGYGYQVDTSVSTFLMLSPTNNAAGRNVSLVPGTYLVSMYVTASVAGQMDVSLYDGTHRMSPRLVQPTTRTRMVFPVTVTDTARVSITIYTNRTAIANHSVVIDSVMIEKRVGATNVASPFVPGSSASSVANTASATSALDARVTSAEGTITSQGTSITNLTSSLSTTDGNVSAAQQAAQAASDLAGSKGKVIVQSTAPAVADRLPQNLWIDTTNNANTPKRWLTNAWVAVTDKVATDAAAAAASALSQVATKADASAVTDLATRVTATEGTVTSQGQSLTSLTNRVATAEGTISSQGTAISGLTNTVTTQGNSITSQGQSITSLNTTVNGISGTGSNLLPAEYCTFSDTAPSTVTGAGITTSVEADAAAFGGYALKFYKTAGTGTVYLAPTSTYFSSNISLKPKKYIISMYARASTNGHQMKFGFRGIQADGTVTAFHYSGNITVSDTWARYSAVVDMTASPADKMCLCIDPKSGTGLYNVNVWVDRIMVEEQVGTGTNPSAFVIGNSATQVAAQGSAIQSLTNRVTSAEGTITTQGQAITSLNNSVANKADSSAVAGLTSRVTAAEGNITSQGSSITALNNSVGSIASDNLLLDPTFSTTSATNQATAVPLARNTAGVPEGAPSARVLKWSVDTTTSNLYMGFSAALNVRTPESALAHSIAVAAGEVYDFEVYSYSTVARQQGIWIQMYDAAGASIAHDWAAVGGDGIRLTSANGVWTKLTGTRTIPAGVIRMAFCLRASVGNASDLYVSSPVARKRASQENAQATATQALDTRVTDAEGTITSQGSSITSLTNRVTTAEGNITSQGSAIGSLTSTVTTQGNTITSQGNSLTALTASLSQAPDNLVLKGTFEDGDIGPWTNGPLIANVTAHAAYSKAIQFYANSFCGTTRNIVTAPGEQFDCSADIWNNYMTSGQTTRLQIQFYDKNVVSLGYYTAFTCYAGTNGFQTYSGRITAPAGSVSARLVIRHETTTETGRSLWCNIICRRVTAADTANADALSSLTTTVTNQGNTITSQGSAITGLQSSVANSGGAGANLLPDTYSWLTSTTLPPTYPNAVTAAGVAVAASASGYGYRCTSTSTNTSAYLALTTIVGAAGYTIPVEAGNYLVSFYASTPTSASIMANLYDGTSRLSISQPITTTRTRYALMVTVAAAAKVAVILYPNRLGVTSTEVIIDSVMLEKMNSGATVTTPSPFVAGPSAAALSAQSAALSALTTRVTATEGDIASQSNSITSLNNSLNNIGGDNMLPNSSFEELASATTTVWWVVAATVAGLVSSIVDSTLPQSTKAQRISHSAIPVNGYAEIRGNNLAADRIKVKGGSPYVLTTWARGTPTAGMAMRQYIGFYDAAGANVGTPTSVAQMTDQFTRYTLAVTAPATAVTALVYAARIINGTSTTSAVWMEVDNVQLQEGTVATAYQPSTEKAVSTLSSAVSSLDSRVTSAEGTITSQGNSITSLNNTVANKADSSALAALTSRVTTAEGNITSQGSSVTTLQNQVNAIGGSGTNLLSDEYSWLTSTTLPTINGSATTTVGVAVAGSASGYGYKMTSTSTATTAYLMLCPTNSAAGWNIPVEVGTYLVSFYASAPATATVRVRLYSATGSAYSTTTVPMTTTRTRYTLQVPFGGVNTVAVLFYYNMSGVSGTEVTVDSVMVEKQVGPTATASPFVAGPSARTVTAQGTALTALTNRVTTAEGTLSSASSAITDLQNTIGTAGAFDSAPGCTWNFDSGLEGWTVGNASSATTAGFVTMTATTVDPQFNSPSTFMNISGALYNRIRAKITRRLGAVTDWDGIAYYSTAGHGFSSSYYLRIANPNLAIGQSAIVEWDMSALTVGGTDWTSNTIQRIRLDFGNTVGGSFEVDWVSVGRVAPSASAGALSSLESTVTQQGSDISAQASSISSLNTTVGGHTTSISTISSTQNTTNGKLNALYSVKLGINSGGKYYAAGMGIGIENTPSGMQSQVLFVADRFAILNSINGTATTPFVVQNGQTFIADAFINKATVTNAIIGSGIYSAAQTNWGGPVMTQDFNAGNVVTRHPTRANTYTVLNQDGLQVVVDGVLRVRMGIW